MAVNLNGQMYTSNEEFCTNSQVCTGEGCNGECRQGQEDDEEDDEDEFEDEEEYYNEGDEEMQYPDDQQMDDGMNGQNAGGIGDEDEEDDEEEYENEYPEDQDEETEIETLESSYIQQTSKYDYGTDNEDEKEGDIVVSPHDHNQDVMRVKILQTYISQEDFNNFLHKCTLNLPPQLS